MIPPQKLQEIKTALLKSQNPLFFFDDDPDGLCSYILLKKLIGRGRGVIIKGSPKLDIRYLRKVREYSPDYIFVLDKPLIDQEFIDQVSSPIIWLDHHPLQQNTGVKYYNPLQYSKDDNRPTSFWAYQISKTSLMYGTIGPIADYYLPPYIDEFSKTYPGLIPKNPKNQGELLYNSRLGDLIRIIMFSLKGTNTDVTKLINVLFRIDNPYEILDLTTPHGAFVYKHAQKILKEYNKIKQDAITSFKEQKSELLVYVYPTKKNSFTSELSTELHYLFKDKVIILGRQKDDEIKMSIRSSKIRIDQVVKKALEGVHGYGGGHPYACGANISTSDFHKFVKQFKSAL